MNQRNERSFGTIALKNTNGKWKVLLIYQHNAWGFSKGHPMIGESPRQTAERELLEETGLQVTHVFSDKVYQESYTFEQDGQSISKRVGYFLAEVVGELKLQIDEVQKGTWISFDQVQHKLTHPSIRSLWRFIAADLKFHKIN